MLFVISFNLHAQEDRRVYKSFQKAGKLENNGERTLISNLKFSTNQLFNFKSELLTSDKPTTSRMVSDYGFNHIIKKDMELVLVGEQSPQAGFSIDVSSKTSVKLSGRIPTNRGISTLELEAGQKENNVPIVEAGKYNGTVDLAFNRHIIVKSNTYTYLNDSPKLYQPVFEKKKLHLDKEMIDSASVLANFLEEIDINAYRVIENRAFFKIEDADSIMINNYDGIEALSILRKQIVPIIFELDFYISLAKKYSTNKLLDSAKTVTEVNEIIQSDTKLKLDLLVDDLKKILTRLSVRHELLKDAERDLASPLWISKHLQWFSISPTIGIKAYKVYGKDDNDVILEKPENKVFWTPKVNFWYSFYDVYKKGANLYRLGLEPIYGNNLEDYTEIKYHENDTLQFEPNGNLVIKEKTTSGLYRKKDSKSKYKVYVNYRLEFYRLPRKNFVPGYSMKFGYVKDGILAEHKRKLRFQAGLVLNLLNQEKSKPIITLQPYLLYDNLLKETVLDKGDTYRNKTALEKLGAGILIGLPIKGLLSIGD
ncbi:hypothetical protein GCM10011325_27040 [Dyadobacter sediminis]|nr:hypothetical protein GCM10011325_27040 [Dyadobacter sediminis]